MLIRSKKDKDPRQRLLELLSCPIFDGVKESRGLDSILEHFVVVSGDSTELKLGISDEDREEIVNNVSIIYNFAATIRFNEQLKRAVMLNLRGTRETLELGKQCKKLEVGFLITIYSFASIYHLLKVFEKSDQSENRIFVSLL